MRDNLIIAIGAAALVLIATAMLWSVRAQTATTWRDGTTIHEEFSGGKYVTHCITTQGAGGFMHTSCWPQTPYPFPTRRR